MDKIYKRLENRRDIITKQPFRPNDKVIILLLKTGSIEYGSVIQQENGVLKTYEGTLLPKIMIYDRNDNKIVLLTSRPLSIPFYVDFWYVGTVV